MNPVFQRFYGENRRLLLVLLGVLAGNLLVSLLLLPRLEASVAAAEAALEGSRKQVREAETEFGETRYRELLHAQALARIARLNTEVLKSDEERFETVDLKIDALAELFGLGADSIKYEWAELGVEKLKRLTYRFRLKGDYEDLRDFVRQIEQATDDAGRDLFFAIEQVSIQHSNQRSAENEKEDELNLSLSLATYFHAPELVERKGRRGRRSRTR